MRPLARVVLPAEQHGRLTSAGLLSRSSGTSHTSGVYPKSGGYPPGSVGGGGCPRKGGGLSVVFPGCPVHSWLGFVLLEPVGDRAGGQ